MCHVTSQGAEEPHATVDEIILSEPGAGTTQVLPLGRSDPGVRLYRPGTYRRDSGDRGKEVRE